MSEPAAYPDPYGVPQSYGFPTTYGRPVQPPAPDASAASQPYAPQPYAPQSGVPQSPVPEASGYRADSPVSTPGAAVQPYTQQFPQPPVWGRPMVPQDYGQPAATWDARPAVASVSAGGRLGGALLDFLLFMVTLGIGWWIWSLISWSSGQSPAKQLLGHVVADATTGEQFDWGRMALREFLIRGLLFGLVNVLTAGIFGLVDALFVLGADHRTLHDKVAGSIVRYR